MSAEESERFLSKSTEYEPHNPRRRDVKDLSSFSKYCGWKLCCCVFLCIIVSILAWIPLISNHYHRQFQLAHPIDANYKPMLPMHPMQLQHPTIHANHHDHAIKEFDHTTEVIGTNPLNKRTRQVAKHDIKENNNNNDKMMTMMRDIKNGTMMTMAKDTQTMDKKQNDIKTDDHKTPDTSNILFEWNPLDIDTKHQSIHVLTTDITSLLINETVSEKEVHSNFFGPHSFHIKYPQLDTDKYAVNEIRKYCFYFHLQDNEYHINHAQIDIVFNDFKLESGFDRIMIRHFNESFVDPPIALVGKEYDFDSTKYPNAYQDLLDSMQQTFFLTSKESKTICIEFQSDDSIVDEGFDLNLNIQYDTCAWTEWQPCTTLNLVGVRWSRGPMGNGKCGVGVMTRQRTTNNGTATMANGYTNCANTVQDGPQFCIKSPCSNYDNDKDKDYPGSPNNSYSMPGWAWYVPSRYYNGVGRYDPVYPDPFRLYLSQNKHRPFSDIAKSIDDLLAEIKRKMLNISDDHYHPNVLRYGVQDPQHKEETAELLGARVADSLLIGRPFIMDVTGDSVTSGHDNLQESVYGMQTQSRLRDFFVRHGVRGSSFQVRNIAEGGGVSSNTQGFMPIPMSTENYDYFSPLYKRINDEIDNEDVRFMEDEYRFITAGFPVRNIDVLLWEFHFTDGRSTNADREMHLREGALLNAIWGVQEPIGGIRFSESCKKWDAVKNDMQDFTQFKTSNWNEIVPSYVDHSALGTVLITPDHGMRGACHILLNGTVVSDPRWGDNGELYPGTMYGYTSYWLKANWHPNTRGHRVIADILAYWVLESAYNFLEHHKKEMVALKGYVELYEYLRDKSGDWKSKIMNSITSGDTMQPATDEGKEGMFVRPTYCGQGNGKCASVPFALTSYKPQMFNTHFKLRDYVVNRVPWDKMESDLGWKLWNDDNIVSMERKTGSPGNMDMKFHFMYDNAFYLDKYRAYQGGNAEEKPNREGMDQFEQYLIENELYLQVKVSVPKYGNGTVEVFHQFGCTVQGRDWDGITSQEYVRRYIARVDEPGVGRRMGNITVSQCKFQGLETGQKYKLSVVPYNIWNHRDKNSNWQFGFVLAY
eukprot:635422_1